MPGMNEEGRRWYVVNTYSGHENKVKENLEKRVESMDCKIVYLILLYLNMWKQKLKMVRKSIRLKICFLGMFW